ncbi:hypothetical protein OS493_022196 [Desmophyllum pertusum]|uniref:Uncharacterized protein n=1 Tax=Desmophyllum pertusum TaxID=174260 RepID=A0A9W9YCG4_9CNID|nr:hypothetical protein OS493_022196 [Desmophyllum pertusum]
MVWTEYSAVRNFRNTWSHSERVKCHVTWSWLEEVFQECTWLRQLLRMKKESNVCLFEKYSRFGGRDYDFRFSRAPNISITFVSLVVIVVVLAALLAHERGKENSARDAPGLEEESSLTSMSCDVVVVGGGISGMYMAETLVRMKKETNVCLFEKDSRFGGRDYDVRFSQAPNIAISLGAWRVDKRHKKVMNLARRFKIPMLKMGHEKVVLFEARGLYASNLQSLKEQAFPTLLSGPFAKHDHVQNV